MSEKMLGLVVYVQKRPLERERRHAGTLFMYIHVEEAMRERKNIGTSLAYSAFEAHSHSLSRWSVDTKDA